MTYTATDASRQDGRPVELYRFVNQAQAWRYCTGEADQVYLSALYTATQIVRGETGASQEFGKNQLRIAVPFDNPLARLLASGYLSGALTVTVFRTHLDDGEFITHWRGRVVGTAWRDADCELLCEPVFTSLQRTGLRAVYQLQCRHAVYGTGCGAAKSAFGIAGTISTAIENQVFVPEAAAYPDDHFSTGMLTTDNGSRMIVKHTGSSLTLVTPIPGLVGGQAVTAYPGCDHALATCDSKFGNSINYGGQPWIPQKNPFSGDAIV